MANKTWGSRFGGTTDPQVEAFTESISCDQRLYRHDVLASQAHAWMLAAVGLIADDEARQICATLDRIAARIANGSFEFFASQEDIHTHIENALIAELGDIGRKLHTGRSRNDQVSTDLRLWLRDAIDEFDRDLCLLQRAFLALAERERDVVMPGYTHLQRAQPILAAHGFLAYVEKLQRDRDRLADCCHRANVSPLGAAALAGTSLPIDRERVAAELGFAEVARNSIDAVSDRDFVIEYVFNLSMIALHLSGWAEEWIIWSTTEFGFLELPDGFCTGSSLMPHKKNPDVLELIRARSSRAAAALHGLMMLVKGLPPAYNRDLQEDKAALFGCHDSVMACVRMATALVGAAKLRRGSIERGLHSGFLDATTVMELLVAQGMPLRSSHEAVGRLVRSSEERGCGLGDLPLEVIESVLPGRGRAVYEMVGVPRALPAFRSFGSTAPAEVDRQLAFWRGRLNVG